MFSLSSPLVQSGVIPLATALVLTGLIRLIGGSRRGPALAGLGLSLAFLASYWATLRIPAFPPAGAANKLFYVVLFATVLGFAADLTGRTGWIGRAIVMLAGPAAALWLGSVSGLKTPWPDGFAVVLVMTASAAAGWKLQANNQRSCEISAAFLVLALGLAGCAFLAKTASSAQLAGGLAAATGGFLLWNWPRARFAFNHAAMAASLALVAGLATQLALFVAKLEVYALLPLIVIPFLVPLGQRLVKGDGLVTQGSRPIAVGLAAAVPAMLAVLLVYLTWPESSVYPDY